ncbi:MAG: hypothetical protein K8L91_01375 [Anaerolineae bacterium]|nr:hypothetical protein [Anaerolineae bacterium]
MNSRIRIGLLLTAMLTLVLFFARTNLPVTQAERPPIEKSSLSQGFTNLAGDGICDGQHLQVNITAGDFPILIQGTGTDLPRTVNVPGMQYLVGPGAWTGLTLTELSGDGEVLALPDVTCTLPPNNLQATMTCDNGDLVVEILSGDPFFAIIGTGPGLPFSTMETGVYRFPGPAIWTNLNVHEPVGNPIEHINFGTIECTGTPDTPEPPPNPPGNLRATMTCDNGDLVVNIQAGDPFFAIIGDGPGLPTSTMETGVYRFPGPAVWTNLNVHEPVGDDIIRFGTLDCRTTTPPETPEPPAETPVPPPAPIVLPDYVPAVVMELAAVTPQIVYDGPAGQPIYRLDGSLLMLPHDADASGADTYLILDAEMVAGEVWVGVYLGGPQLGWLPLASLTPSAE